ncbi:MAG: hypothetical protein WCJ39_04250 [bacterium]
MKKTVTTPVKSGVAMLRVGVEVNMYSQLEYDFTLQGIKRQRGLSDEILQQFIS